MTRPGSPWLLAVAISLGMGMTEGATIYRLVPGTTVVDAGALLVTGFIAGLFAGFHFARRQADR